MKREPAPQPSNVQFACALAAFTLVAVCAITIAPGNRSIPQETVESKLPASGAPPDNRPRIMNKSTDELRDKLKRIVIPEITFKDVTLGDAIDELNKAGFTYDMTRSDRGRRGVNIMAIFKDVAGSESSDAATSPLKTKITISLRKVSLQEALRRVTAKAGVTFRLDRHGVLVTSTSEVEAYSTKAVTRESEIFPNLSASLQSYVPNMNGGLNAANPATTLKSTMEDTEAHWDEYDALVEDLRSKGRETHDAAETPATPGVEAPLQIIIPQIIFKDVSTPMAFAFLRKRSADLDIKQPDPIKRGVNIVETWQGPRQKITLLLTNVPLSVALHYVAAQSGLEVFVDAGDGRVKLARSGNGYKPLAVYEPILQKEYTLPPEFFTGAGGRGVTPQELFESSGVVKFPEGASANYSLQERKLTVCNTRQNLEFIDKIVNASAPQNSAPAKLIRANDKIQAAYELLQRKLDRIIIPRLDLNGVSVQEAAAYLKKQSELADTLTGDTGQKGVDIVAMEYDAPLPRKNPLVPNIPGAVDPAKSQITLHLTNIPIIAAVDYVTKLSSLRYRIEPYAIVVEDVSDAPDPSEFLTEAYSVPADYPAASFGMTKTARDHLEDAGVVFPPGSFAEYLPGPGVVVVRNTMVNMDVVEQVINSDKEEQARLAKEAKRRAEILKMTEVKNGDAVFHPLLNFKLHARGNRIEIVDSDGSVYSGEILQPDLQEEIKASDGCTFNYNMTADHDQQVTSSPSAAQNEQSQVFRVEGTNTTLNMPVVFEGVYVPWIYKRDASDEDKPGAVLMALIKYQRMVNARIHGQAHAGTKTIDIDAMPVPADTKILE